MDSKFCRDCGADRPLSDFTKNRNSSDGHAFYCRRHARARHQTSRDRRTGGPQRRHPREIVVADGHKWCPDCGVVQEVSAFGRNAGAKTGVNSYCKPCHNLRTRRSKERVGGERTYHLRRRYGITAEDVDALMVAQAGLCAVCRAAPAAHVDHDHATGTVRELLCFNCNGGLGQFRDDPAVLRAAADYVERHREGQVAPRTGTAGTRPATPSGPGAPPVGSAPRRSGRAGSARPGGHTSRDSRQQAAGEADA